MKSPAYLRLFREDVVQLRTEVLRAGIGLSVGAVAGLLFIAFFSLAILVSLWDTRLRVPAAWGIAGIWALVALIGLSYARRALQMRLPFSTLIPLLERDLAAIEKEPE